MDLIGVGAMEYWNKRSWKTKAAKEVIFISLVLGGYYSYDFKTLWVPFCISFLYCVKILNILELRIVKYDHKYNWRINAMKRQNSWFEEKFYHNLYKVSMIMKIRIILLAC